MFLKLYSNIPQSLIFWGNIKNPVTFAVLCKVEIKWMHFSLMAFNKLKLFLKGASNGWVGRCSCQYIKRKKEILPKENQQ